MNKLRLIFLYGLAVMFFTVAGQAQIIERPLGSNAVLQNRPAPVGQLRSDQPLDLPFADDFSSEPGYPNPELWADHQAYINNNLALNPPSIGIATLDGLDANGVPYPGGYGGSDTLTSRPINLSGLPRAYLSFYVQPKGIGYQPKAADSLIVEAKDQDGVWRTLEAFEGLDESYINKPAPDFNRVSVVLTSEFLYDKFQFRFRNYSSNQGLESLWHLDYVMVTKEEQDLYVNDIAFTRRPDFLLKRYTAYPLPQIKRSAQDVINNQFPIHLQNNSKVRLTIDTSRVEIYNTETNQTVFADESLLEIPPIVPENQRNINPGPASFTNTFNPEKVVTYLTNTNQDKVALTTEYEYVMRSEQQLPSFLRNNTVTRITHFDNYLSYDDNNVEGSISTYNGNGIKTRIAVEYELIEADSLHTIRILFPYLIQNYEHKMFNLLIFVGELKGEADYTIHDLQPKRGNYYQPFTEYIIRDYIPEGIELPAGKFYIGWEHPRGSTTDYIPFGFDKNYPAANEFIYYNIGGDWLNVATHSPNLQGAIAIRPVVGRHEVLTSSREDVEDLSHLIYPNPASKMLYLRGALADQQINYKIYRMTGQMVLSGHLYRHQNTMDIGVLPPGAYVVHLLDRSNQTVGNLRFIKQ